MQPLEFCLTGGCPTRLKPCLSHLWMTESCRTSLSGRRGLSRRAKGGKRHSMQSASQRPALFLIGSQKAITISSVNRTAVHRSLTTRSVSASWQVDHPVAFPDQDASLKHSNVCGWLALAWKGNANWIVQHRSFLAQCH
jgi:hypothetical protein